MTYTIDIEHEGIVFEVTCWFEKGIKSNDRDVPDDQDDFLVEQILHHDFDFTEILKESVKNKIGDKALNDILSYII